LASKNSTRPKFGVEDLQKREEGERGRKQGKKRTFHPCMENLTIKPNLVNTSSRSGEEGKKITSNGIHEGE